MLRFFVVLLVFLSLTADAQLLCNKQANSLFNNLYNRQLNAVDTVFPNSENKFIYVYDSFWEALIKSELKTFNCTKTNEPNNAELNALYNLLQIRAELAQKNYYKSWKTSVKIKEYYKQNPADSSKHINYFLWGIYNYFAAKIRESVVYKPMLFGCPDANKNLGLSILKQLTLSESVFVSTEAVYLLGKINLEVEQDTISAQKYFEQLNKKFPKNPIYKELLSIKK